MKTYTHKTIDKEGYAVPVNPYKAKGGQPLAGHDGRSYSFDQDNPLILCPTPFTGEKRENELEIVWQELNEDDQWVDCSEITYNHLRAKGLSCRQIARLKQPINTVCNHEGLEDTGTGWYLCPSCKKSWTPAQWRAIVEQPVNKEQVVEGEDDLKNSVEAIFNTHINCRAITTDAIFKAIEYALLCDYNQPPLRNLDRHEKIR